MAKTSGYGEVAVYSAALPTLADGDSAALQVDINGKLITTASGGGGGASTADGAAFTTGTTAGTIAMGVYQSTPSTITDGTAAAVAIDQNRNVKFVNAFLGYGEDATNNVQGVIQKPIAAATYSPATYQQSGSVTKASVKATPGNVFSIYATNASGSPVYLQLHNKATAPAAGDTRLIEFIIPAFGQITIGTDFFTQPGKNHATGIGFALFTTSTTFTDSATASNHLVTINYI